MIGNSSHRRGFHNVVLYDTHKTHREEACDVSRQRKVVAKENL